MHKMMFVCAACTVLSAFGAIHPWAGKNVAFLGDSITDPAQTNRQDVYWQYLEKETGIKPHVYAVGGFQWIHIGDKIRQMQAEMGESVDAIFILLGTNDYNGGVPLGEWFECHEEDVNRRGVTIRAERRIFRRNMGTFKGRINTVMSYLKANFPKQQIVLMTPLHRGYAKFGDTNIQPEESFPNVTGAYLDEYVAALREAADIWSVPLIDLYRESGLFPTDSAYAPYFRDGGAEGKDNLHPNSEGHRRMAKVIAARMSVLPPDFK